MGDEAAKWPLSLDGVSQAKSALYFKVPEKSANFTDAGLLSSLKEEDGQYIVQIFIMFLGRDMEINFSFKYGNSGGNLKKDSFCFRFKIVIVTHMFYTLSLKWCVCNLFADMYQVQNCICTGNKK